MRKILLVRYRHLVELSLFSHQCGLQFLRPARKYAALFLRLLGSIKNAIALVAILQLIVSKADHISGMIEESIAESE